MGRLGFLARGLATYIPGVVKYAGRIEPSAASSRYCYSVWLRHLVSAHRHNLPTQPGVVAELGPGSTLGMGIASLLTGADRYYGLDIQAHNIAERNFMLLDELVELFRQRADVPAGDEFPKTHPLLESYEFPAHILTDERLAAALEPARIERIRDSLRNTDSPDSMIAYKAPWFESRIVQPGTVDWIFSQSVLYQLDDPLQTFKVLYQWLKPGGIMTHQTNFTCLGISPCWYEHLTIGDLTWKLMRGRRPSFLNRLPLSTLKRQLQETGFQVVGEIVSSKEMPDRNRLATRFRSWSDADLTTGAACILSQRPG